MSSVTFEVTGRVARITLDRPLVCEVHGFCVAGGTDGLHATQVLGAVFDGIARHTEEGYAFQGLAAREGFRAAVRARDEPFGDYGPSTFKG